ncbi:uncharacterized protein PV09_03838 [Verruconis gallopava]|uniref:Uncharacterized protein n=1 Tax=Verruconis gallopava TaxID=253628 RepID=A0A0D2B1W4_9PEZI|nr:uncharacterized protein PV09_03838 [Verruconis gallopava]KIW05314.1 hypothetical protein PV09_03838 [Verruconis gallopava]
MCGARASASERESERKRDNFERTMERHRAWARAGLGLWLCEEGGWGRQRARTSHGAATVQGQGGAAIEGASVRSSVLRNASPKTRMAVIGVTLWLSLFSAVRCYEDHRPLGLMTLTAHLLLINRTPSASPPLISASYQTHAILQALRPRCAVQPPVQAGA